MFCYVPIRQKVQTVAYNTPFGVIVGQQVYYEQPTLIVSGGGGISVNVIERRMSDVLKPLFFKLVSVRNEMKANNAIGNIHGALALIPRMMSAVCEFRNVAQRCDSVYYQRNMSGVEEGIKIALTAFNVINGMDISRSQTKINECLKLTSTILLSISIHMKWSVNGGLYEDSNVTRALMAL